LFSQPRAAGLPIYGNDSRRVSFGPHVYNVGGGRFLPEKMKKILKERRQKLEGRNLESE
jgi:hypothetical protein